MRCAFDKRFKSVSQIEVDTSNGQHGDKTDKFGGIVGFILVSYRYEVFDRNVEVLLCLLQFSFERLHGTVK